MPILFSCKTCGKPYQVDERFAGKKATCRACKTINAIPNPEDASDQTVAGLTSLQTAPVRVAPADAPPQPPHSASPRPNLLQAVQKAAAEEELELCDEVELVPEAAPPPAAKIKKVLPLETCPECAAPLAAGAALCTACGFNLKTGQKIATAIAAPSAAAPADPATDPDLPAPPNVQRIAALVAIIIGLLLSILPLLGVHSLASTGPLTGAALSMIGAAIYFIDGAWEWGLAGAGAMMVSVVILLAFGNNAAPATPAPIASTVPPPPLTPATTQSADAGAKIVEISPGKFNIREPDPRENPVAYWLSALADENPKIRAIVLDRLAALPPRYANPAAAAIAQAVGDEDVEIRRTALKYLSRAHTQETVAAAIKALDDPDAAIRERALKLLADDKDDAAIEPLARHYTALGTPILDALAGYPKASKEKVMAAYRTLLDSADTGGRAKIIEILALDDPDAAAKLLMANLTDGNENIRRAAMLRLAQMQYPPAIAPIAEHLRDDPEFAGKALITFGAPAEKTVAAKLAEGDPATRAAALNVLGQIGTAQSLEPIEKIAKDTDFPLAMTARAIWRKIEPGAFPPAEEALYDLDGRKEFLTRALNTLKTLPPEEHQKTIAKKLFELALNEPDPATRALAIDALKIWADEAVKDSIIATLHSDIDETKRATAISLAVFFKDPRAVRPLCQCLAEGKNIPDVLPALKEFGPAPEEFLIPLLTKSDPTVQANCFDILRDIGTRRCFMALNTIIKNKTAEEPVRKQAKETLIGINRRLNTAEAQAQKNKPPLPPPTIPTAPAH